jgi:hypothetical protein
LSPAVTTCVSILVSHNTEGIPEILNSPSKDDMLGQNCSLTEVVHAVPERGQR